MKLKSLLQFSVTCFMEMDRQFGNSIIFIVLYIVAYPAFSMNKWIFVMVFIYLPNVSIVKIADSESSIDNGIYNKKHSFN